MGRKKDTVDQYLEQLAAEKVQVQLVDAAGLKALRQSDSGKVRLINFWATWCGPCITEFPDLITINRMYRHRAFELITISANYPDEKKEVLAFLQKNQASGRNLLFGETDKYRLAERLIRSGTAHCPIRFYSGRPAKCSTGTRTPLKLWK